MVTIRRPQVAARDRRHEIEIAFKNFERRLENGDDPLSSCPFSLASLKSTKNGNSVSASDDFKDILRDISLIRKEAQKYSGSETPLSKTIYEAGVKLKFKLDSTKFDEDFRGDRKQQLTEIDQILDSLKKKIH